MDITDRLNQFIKDKNLTIKEFAELIEMDYESFQPYTVTRNTKGKRRPGIKTLEKLFKVGCDLNWLIVGKKIDVNSELEERIKIINKILKKYDIQSLEDLEEKLKSIKYIENILNREKNN